MTRTDTGIMYEVENEPVDYTYTPYTKKAPNEVYKIAAAYRPTLPKTSTTDQCWGAIADENDLEMCVERGCGTIDITVYKAGEKVMGMNMNDSTGWNAKEYDWCWDRIFTMVIRDLKDKKLIRSPRRSKKTGEIILSKKEQKRLATPTYTQEQKEEMKKLNRTLYNKKKTCADPEGIKKIEERLKEIEQAGLENTRKGVRK